jgi:acid phosphatase
MGLSRVLFTSNLVLPGVAASFLHDTRAIDTAWHAPAKTQINNLTSALNSDGVYGFIFNSSSTPNHNYGTYNWCNMPHVRPAEYVVADKTFELQYVELVR